MSLDIAQLISNHYRQLRNVALSYADFEECEDLLQEISLQLWRSRAHFRGDAQQSTWMYRVAINTAITYQRKKISQRKLQTVSEDKSIQQAELSGMGQEQMLVAFAKGLNKVDRAIFAMYVDGLTAGQIEAVLDISTNAIKVRISRMKERFRQQFVD